MSEQQQPPAVAVAVAEQPPQEPEQPAVVQPDPEAVSQADLSQETRLTRQEERLGTVAAVLEAATTQQAAQQQQIEGLQSALEDARRSLAESLDRLREELRPPPNESVQAEEVIQVQEQPAEQPEGGSPRRRPLRRGLIF